MTQEKVKEETVDTVATMVEALAPERPSTIFVPDVNFRLIGEESFINRSQNWTPQHLQAKILLSDIHVKAFESHMSDNPEDPRKESAGQRVHREGLILRLEQERRKQNGAKMPSVTVGMKPAVMGASAKMG